MSDGADAVDADAFFGALLGPQHAVALRWSRDAPARSLAGAPEEAPPRRLRFRWSWTHFVPCLIAAPANLKVLSQPAGHMNRPNSFFSK